MALEIYYKSDRLKKYIYSSREIQRKCGILVFKKLSLRMTQMQAVDSIEQLSPNPPMCRHKLKGGLSSLFAVTVYGQYRIVFEPMNGDYKKSLSSVTKIRIIEFSNHYKEFF